MTRTLRLALVAGFLLVSPAVFGDGVVISPTAFARVEVPDQSALIAYDGETERLLIETSFIGQGSNFAWIVPLPTKPEIETSTTGVVPTLQFICRPDVIHNVPHLYGGLLALGALLYLFMTVRPTGRLTAADCVTCCLMTLGLLMLTRSPFFSILSLTSILAVSGARRGGSLLLQMLLAFLITVILSGLTLSAGGGRSASANVVQVLDRKTVGAFETSTITSPDGSALMSWLAQNGYGVATNLAPRVREYAREGWVFVATRIRRDADTSSVSATHPLVFTFKTKQPGYPMRLTGALHDRCKVDLYVFGPGRAQVSGFNVERCETLRQDEWKVNHPQILRLIGTAEIATKLSAHLRAAEMDHDVVLTWERFERTSPVRFTHEGALILAVNLGTGVLGLTLAGLLLARRLSVIRPSRFWPLAGRLALFSLACGVVFYMVLPKTSARLVYAAKWGPRLFHRIAVANLNARYEQTRQTNQAFSVTLPWLREQMKDVSSQFRSKRQRDNPYTGQGYCEEDSPGNYIFRESGGHFVYVYYEPDGMEEVTPLFGDRH
jgi:hypothetical protein